MRSGRRPWSRRSRLSTKAPLAAAVAAENADVRAPCSVTLEAWPSYSARPRAISPEFCSAFRGRGSRTPLGFCVRMNATCEASEGVPSPGGPLLGRKSWEGSGIDLQSSRERPGNCNYLLNSRRGGGVPQPGARHPAPLRGPPMGRADSPRPGLRLGQGQGDPLLSLFRVEHRIFFVLR